MTPEKTETTAMTPEEAATTSTTPEKATKTLTTPTRAASPAMTLEEVTTTKVTTTADVSATITQQQTTPDTGNCSCRPETVCYSYYCQCLKKGFIGEKCDINASFSLTSHIQTRKVPIILKPITSYKALTITFWLMLTENVTSVTQHIFTMSLLPITNNHCNDLGVIRYIDGNNLRVYIAQLAYDMVIPEPVQKWTHIGVVYSDLGFEIYMNGGYLGKYVFNKVNPKTVNVVQIILANDADETTSQTCVAGLAEEGAIASISHFFVWSKALIPSEIAKAYQKDPVMNDLLISWEEFRLNPDLVTPYPF